MNYQLMETPLTPSERWNQLRGIYIDQILFTCVVIILVALPISLSRAFVTGWNPLYTGQLFLAIIFAGFYSLRKRLTFFVKSWFAIAFLGIVGVSALITLGLAGNGVAWLLFVNVLVATIYPPRTTTIVGIVSLAILVIVGIGIITGKIRPPINANDYVIQISSWATVWVGLAVVFFTTFRSIGILQQATRHLLEEIQKQQEQIAYLANHDQLTGLPLMRLARDRLEVASNHAKRNNKKVAVLFIDLDGFKRINDTFGHDSGDYFLQQTAQRIRQTIRSNDTIARISGDEFLVILGDVSEVQLISNVAFKIASTLSNPIIQGSKIMAAGASIGIAIFPDDATDLDTLKRLADEAMYKVKREGKSSYSFINASIDQLISGAE